MTQDIGRNLAQLRREHGYSQEKLAERLGVSEQEVSKWERAESAPDTDHLIALAKLYGCTLDALVQPAKAVDAELLERYKRIKGRYAVPMAKVENNQCSGCNMSLPTSTVKRVATGEGIVECENCGRILYA